MKKFMNKIEKATGLDLDGDGTVGGATNAPRNGYQNAGYQNAGYQGYTNQMPAAAPAHGGGLPPGWEAKVDPNSGRTFYLNHQTQRTQWEPPAGVSAAPAPPVAHAGGGGGGPKFCSNCGTKLTPGPCPNHLLHLVLSLASASLRSREIGESTRLIERRVDSQHCLGTLARQQVSRTCPASLMQHSCVLVAISSGGV
eukprot:2986475-Rhodomonas_salina.2